MRTCSSADCIKRLRCPTVCGWLNKCPNCSSQTPPRDQECIISELACPTVGCTGSRVAVRLQAQPSLTPSSIRPGAPEAAQPGQVLPPTHRQPTGASAHCIAWLSAKQNISQFHWRREMLCQKPLCKLWTQVLLLDLKHNKASYWLQI